MDKNKLKTKCYYTDYVNHMIRFYMTTPDTLSTDGKRGADISNWLAVQSAMRNVKEEDRVLLLDVYSRDYRLPRAVEKYCQEKGADERDVWRVITKILSMIARQRGLI